MGKIVDQFGRPFYTRTRPQRQVLAAAPLLDSWRQYVAAGLTPRKLAATLKQADAGDVARQAELFEQMEERDGHLLGERGKRVNVIMDVKFNVKPAADDSRAVQVAEFVDKTLKALTDYPDLLVALQDAVGKGFAAAEPIWDVSAGQAVPTRFEFVSQRRFLFADRSGLVRRTPLLLTDDAPTGVEIPAWKIILHSYGGKSGHPARAGIYRVCAWWYLFKNYAVKDWLAFCEVYGMPLRIGKYAPGASEDDKRALAEAVTSLGSDAAGIISTATQIELVESVKGKASGDLYQALAKFANREMSKALLGQTLTAEVGDKGSYAASKTHNEVRRDLLLADARALAATIRTQLIRPLVGFNFGWDAPVPLYEASLEEPDDLSQTAEWITSLLDRNVTMPLAFIRRKFGIPEPQKGEEVVGGPNVAAAKIVAKAAAGTPNQEAIDALADQVAAAAAAAVEVNEQAIVEAVRSAGSWDEAIEAVLGLYPTLDMDQVAELLERAMLNSELFGRWTVEDETGA